MDKNNIACVIITYNIGEELYKCYNSIKKQVGKVILVDNGSDYETIQVLNKIENLSNTSVIYNTRNLGIAKALNIGVEKAIKEDYKWILTMDNDSVATKNMIKNMMKTYDQFTEEEKKNIVSLAPRFVDNAYAERKYVNEEVGDTKKIIYKDLVITSGNLVASKVYEEIGFYREDYFIDYVDNEFCLRIIEKNMKIIEIPSAILIHKLGAGVSKKILFKTIESTNHSAIRRYYLTRNSLDVMKNFKHLKVKHIVNTRRVLLRFILEILLVEKNKMEKIKYMYRGFKDYKNQRFGELC